MLDYKECKMETRENLCSDPTNLEMMRFAVPPVVRRSRKKHMQKKEDMNHHAVPKVPGRQPGLALRLGTPPHPPLPDQDQISLDVSNLLFTLQKLSGCLLSHRIIQVENH